MLDTNCQHVINPKQESHSHTAEWKIKSHFNLTVNIERHTLESVGLYQRNQQCSYTFKT